MTERSTTDHRAEVCSVCTTALPSDAFKESTDNQVNSSDDAFVATGPERFAEYGLPLLATDTRYYFYPAEQIDFSPEELVCHMLLIDSGTRFRSYCLLLLSSVDVNDALLKSRATHYGVFELIEQLIEYLETRGGTTAQPLPSWDEFQALAEEYEVPV